jgi:competence ComEA-like helix-hairpin-helix protein
VGPGIRGNKMNISNECLDEYIKSWDESHKWKENEIASIREVLKKISLNNGGNILYDEPLKDEIENAYILNTIEDSINRLMNIYANSIQVNQPDFYPVLTDRIFPEFDFLEGSYFREKININTATEREMKKLPDIGTTVARRIREHREKYGTFKSIQEIKQIRGLGKNSIEKIKDAISISGRGEVSFLTPCLIKFKTKPCFGNYIEILKTTGGLFNLNGENVPQGNIKTAIIRELRKIEAYNRRNYYYKFGKYHKIKASEINEDSYIRQKAKEIRKRAPSRIKGVACINNDLFLDFLLKAISYAKNRIYISMYFLKSEKDLTGLMNKLLEQLLQAKSKGVTIKIIMGKGSEDIDCKTRIKNKELLEFLEKHGENIITEIDDDVSHSKMVIIDQHHVILGSHNWREGCFFPDDDKFFYIESTHFCICLSQYFRKLWHLYRSGISTIPIKITKLTHTLSRDHIEELLRQGIMNTSDFLEYGCSSEERELLSQRTGIPEDTLITLTGVSDLMRIKGINEEEANLFMKLEIHSTEQLALEDPVELYKRLKSLNPFSKDISPKLETNISIWIQTAKKLMEGFQKE